MRGWWHDARFSAREALDSEYSFEHELDAGYYEDDERAIITYRRDEVNAWWVLAVAALLRAGDEEGP